MLNQTHPFHLVSPSPWPIILSINLMNNLLYMIIYFNDLQYMYFMPFPIFINTLMCSYLWWRDMVREATFQGCHTTNVYKGMQKGMILFIISEILFFFSFFWTYYHSSLAPNIEIGQLWPPQKILPFDPFDIPLLNTIILLSSGISMTWSHHAMINNNLTESKKALSITIILGIYFTMLQTIEYFEAPFSLADSIYGSIFFIATGFHGIHVILGSLFLMFCLIRMFLYHFSSTHHFGFEAAAWYWHFVDMIWLFLYLSIYWWSF